MPQCVCCMQASSKAPATRRNRGIPRWILLGRIRPNGRKRVIEFPKIGQEESLYRSSNHATTEWMQYEAKVELKECIKVHESRETMYSMKIFSLLFMTAFLILTVAGEYRCSWYSPTTSSEWHLSAQNYCEQTEHTSPIPSHQNLHVNSTDQNLFKFNLKYISLKLLLSTAVL